MYEPLQALIPEFDPQALINYPGRYNGIVMTSTLRVREQMRNELEPSPDADAPPPPTRNSEGLLLQLRSKWNGLYLSAMDRPEKVQIYRGLLGVDPKNVRGEKRVAIVQVIGAIEERLGRAGLTTRDLQGSPDISIDPSSTAEEQARYTRAVTAMETSLQIAAEARTLLGRSAEHAMSL